MNNKSKAIILIVLLVLSLALTSCKKDVSGADVLVTVGDRVVDRGYFEAVHSVYRMFFEEMYGKEVWDEVIYDLSASEFVKRETLDYTIMFKSAEIRLVEWGISVTDQEYEAQFAAISKNFAPDGNLSSLLRKYGIKESDFRLFTRGATNLGKVNEYIMVNLEITEEHALKFYENNLEYFAAEQVRASHVLLETYEEALAVKAQYEAGTHFAELAMKYSIEDIAQFTGGDLDFFEKHHMVAPFSEAAFSMEIGQVSDPVETEYGYHIILVTDRRDYYPFEGEIKDYLMEDANVAQEIANEMLMEGIEIVIHEENL